MAAKGGDGDLSTSCSDGSADHMTDDVTGRVTVHGQAERVDLPGHPLVISLGLLLMLALFALGAVGLGNSLGSKDSKDVIVVVVPRGNGRPAAEVQRQLERLGLFVEIKYASNETAPADTVTAQEPIAGSRIEVGKLVVLTVSDGPAGVQVPDAAGLQRIAATNLLQVVGLGTIFEEVYDENVRVGEVVSTRPEAGSRAQLGSTITVMLSKGPRPRVVPEVVGLDEARAFALIGNAELQIGKIERRTTNDPPAGTVISASPEAGSEVPRATPIKLIIARAPEQITVPDLVLMTQTSASSIASNVGVRIRTQRTPVPAGDTRDGIVLSQVPIAGSLVDKGTTIDLNVGSAPRAPEEPDSGG